VTDLHRNLLVLLLLFVVSVNAQPPAGTWPSGSMPFKIKGKVVEEGTKMPMEYCTISLIRVSDSGIESGTITDEKGFFTIEEIKPGVYHLDVSYIGFQTQRIENIKLNKDNMQVDLGTIKLASDAKKLEEVEVTTMRTSVKYEIDKKVVNVDKQLVAGSGTAVDVLETVPSVQVGVDGNVSLRGSTSFTVFVNGRMSVLNANEALRQIPAAIIESIEIITNPSAKYDAEGTAGIINIILKKNRESGISGAVNARAGNFGNYGGDATLSYNVKKFTLYSSANFNRNPNPSFYDAEMISQFGDSIFTTISTSERNRVFNNASGKLDMEYRMNDNHSVNVGGTLGKWWMDVYNDVDFEVSNNFMNEIDRFNSINETDRYSLFYEGRIDYTGKWKKHKLLYHTSFTGRNDHEYIYNFQSRDEIVYFGTKSSEVGPAQRLRVNLDYEYKVDDRSKFELGFLHQYNATQKDARVFFLDEPDFEFELQDQFSQDIDFKKNIRAFYGQYSTKFNKLGVQVGVRTENTHRVITVPQDNGRYVLDRLDFFPSAYLSYKLDDYNQLYLNYSRRIEQPRGWYLEPNRVYVDANTLWQGDPALDPTFISSFDFGYIRNFKKKGSFTMEGYYRYETNTIEVYTAPLEENFVIRRPANAGIAHNLGVEPRLNYPVFKWWDLDISANIFYLNISGALNEFTFERSSIIGIGSVNNFFAISKNTRLQFDARYFSPRIVAQGKTNDYFAFNFGLRQDFLKKALAVSLQLRNAFGTIYRETFTEFTGYSFYEIDIPRWPQFFVNVSYRINNYKPKRMGGGGFDDI
jgi:outer membrane receptor protein involved in Fe transport